MSLNPVPAGRPLWTDEQLTDRLGIEILEYSVERTVGTMPVAGNRQPYGLLHGGASAALAETLGSMAAALWWQSDGSIAVGIELGCTHHRSATEGVVTAVATPSHLGGTLATYDIVITDTQDRRLCTARLTCLRRPGPG